MPVAVMAENPVCYQRLLEQCEEQELEVCDVSPQMCAHREGEGGAFSSVQGGEGDRLWELTRWRHICNRMISNSRDQ